jgi:pyruvate-formate lyase-activating enzyme
VGELLGVLKRQSVVARAAWFVHVQPIPPLLVPGYVDAEQVGKIARFIAKLEIHIPYTLLAFVSNFDYHDLLCTAEKHARKAEAAAWVAGLLNVRIGNRQLIPRNTLGTCGTRGRRILDQV